MYIQYRLWFYFPTQTQWMVLNQNENGWCCHRDTVGTEGAASSSFLSAAWHQKWAANDLVNPMLTCFWFGESNVNMFSYVLSKLFKSSPENTCWFMMIHDSCGSHVRLNTLSTFRNFVFQVARLYRSFNFNPTITFTLEFRDTFLFFLQLLLLTLQGLLQIPQTQKGEKRVQKRHNGGELALTLMLFKNTFWTGHLKKQPTSQRKQATSWRSPTPLASASTWWPQIVQQNRKTRAVKNLKNENQWFPMWPF